MKTEELIKAIKTISSTSSEEWRSKVISNIHLLKEEKTSNNFSLFNNLLTMKKLIPSVALALVISVATGGYLHATSPYTKALSHLENASDALTQLKSLASTETFPAKEASLFNTAYADSTSAEQTVELIKTVESETDEATTEIEDIDDADDAAEVLTELDKVQDDTVDTLSTVIASTTDDQVIEAAATSVENADAGNEVVENTLKQPKESIKKLKEKIKEKRAEKHAKKNREN